MTTKCIDAPQCLRSGLYMPPIVLLCYVTVYKILYSILQ